MGVHPQARRAEQRGALTPSSAVPSPPATRTAAPLRRRGRAQKMLLWGRAAVEGSGARDARGASVCSDSAFQRAFITAMEASRDKILPPRAAVEQRAFRSRGSRQGRGRRSAQRGQVSSLLQILPSRRLRRSAQTGYNGFGRSHGRGRNLLLPTLFRSPSHEPQRWTNSPRGQINTTNSLPAAVGAHGTWAHTVPAGRTSRPICSIQNTRIIFKCTIFYNSVYAIYETTVANM